MRGWLVTCPHDGCTWETFNANQQAVNKAYDRHAAAKHKQQRAITPQLEQLDLDGQGE